MRTCALLLSIILWAGTAAGQIIYTTQPWNPGIVVMPKPDWGTAEILPSVRDLPEPFLVTPTLPATITMKTPVDIAITPSMPTPQDEVVVTITGWKQVTTHVVDRVEVRTDGREILVDVYWIDAPPPPPSPWICQAQNQSVEQVPLTQMTSMFQKYEITRSLGTFEPGTYAVHVTNRGVMSGDTSASFTVRDLGSFIELDNSFWPYWLFPF